MTTTQTLLSHIDDYASPYLDMRIEGFRMLKSAGLRIPEPLYIVRPEAFNYYRRSGLSKGFTAEIELAAAKILRENPGKGVAVRRAFFIRNFSNPPGPRSGPLFSPESVSRFVKKIFDFAKDELREYIASESHFACILHPFISPDPMEGEAGCHAYLFQRGSNSWALIRASYGNDEGVMELRNSVDQYEVNLSRDVVERFPKHIHLKGLVVTAKGAKEVRVPPHLVRRAVLSEDQIHEISALLRTFYQEWTGKLRLEFSVTSEGIFFTECANYTATELDRALFSTSESESLPKLGMLEGRVGTVVRIDENKQMGLGKLSEAILIYIPNMKRDLMIRTTLRIAKGARSGVIVLFPGSLS